MTDVPATVALEAADPTTAPARLAEIAASSPSLHGAILQNPSTYADLRQWIADYPAPAPATPPETVVLAPDRQPASSPGAATPLASGGRAVSMAAAVGGSLGLVLILVVGSAIAFAVMTSSRPAYYEYSDYDVSDPATQDEANASEGDAATGSGNNLPGDTFVVDSRIPASCDSMFSPAMRAQLEAAGLSLNPPRVVGNGSLGSRDPTIASFVQQPLVCIWADA
ncbi:MAG TPA: hypothetical protein PK373_11105, partial [Sedimentisphaerales bacterium]|nr:hypothetical protein [Sedimentisphaerales bacterium]